MSESSGSEVKKRRSNRCLSPGVSKKSNCKTGPLTNEEKEVVLCALYAHGPYVDKIAPLLPGRSREQVRDFLTSWYRRVRKVPAVLSEKDYQTSMIKEPIEIWLDKIKKETKAYVSSNEGNLMYPWYPCAVGYIVKYENHPPTTETGGVDFKKLYEFLETMLHGNAPKALSYVDALFVLTSLRKLKSRLEKIDFHKDEMYLKRCCSSQGIAVQPRTYKRVKKEELDESHQTTTNNLEALLLSKIMNPLNMPMDTLSVKERLKSQSTV